MSSLKDKITSKVTGDAYDKPAKTVDGAMTTQDSDNAHTVKGTSADPNPPDPEPSKLEQMGNKVGDNIQQKADKAQEIKDKGQDKLDNTSAGQKVQEGDLGGAGQKATNQAKEETDKRTDQSRT